MTGCSFGQQKSKTYGKNMNSIGRMADIYLFFQLLQGKSSKKDHTKGWLSAVIQEKGNCMLFEVRITTEQ